MAKLPLYATGITASFTILLTTAMAQDVALLKQARQESLATWAAATDPVSARLDRAHGAYATAAPDSRFSIARC
jgi:hypothetical protein